MPETVLCPFCRGPLLDAPKPDQLTDRVERCPRCAGGCTAAQSLDQARGRLADALQSPPASLEIQAVVVSGSNLLVFVAWNLEEELKPSQVAKIVDLHTLDVNRRLRQGRFEGAYRDTSVRGGVGGEWRVPRRSVLAFMRAGRKPGTGGPREPQDKADGRLKANRAKRGPRQWKADTKRSVRKKR